MSVQPRLTFITIIPPETAASRPKIKSGVANPVKRLYGTPTSQVRLGLGRGEIPFGPPVAPIRG